MKALMLMRLEKATADSHMDCRRLDVLDSAFHLGASNRHAYWVTNTGRAANQPDWPRLRLCLPLELNQLEADSSTTR